jgi:hypothetical protein
MIMKPGFAKAWALGVLVTACGPAGPALAQKQAHREASTHVHGAAELSFVISGNDLLVDLDSPLVNIVGFEHAPKTSTERKTADAATRLLNDPARIAVPSPEAECVAATASVALPFDPASTHGEKRAGGKEEHEADANSHDHIDVQVSYAFACARMERLEHIEVTALKTFPGIKAAQVVFLGPKAQFSRELNASSSRLRLK